MQLSQYLELAVANWIRGTDMDAPPGVLTLALSTADPTDTGAGLAEPGGNYVRQTITFDAPTVGVSGVQIASASGIVFPIATASYGTITHIAVYSGSNMLFYGALAAPKLVSIGDSFSVSAGDIQHTFKPKFSTYLGTLLGNYIRGTAAPTAPVTVSAALSAADPTVSGAGLIEPPNTDNYFRQNITFGVPVALAGVGTTITNDSAIIFGPCATNNWPAVTHFALMAGANQIVFGDLAAARSAEIGDAIPLAVGAVSLLIR